MTDHQGGWQLVTADGGRTTQAQYQMRIDLGGSLPSFLARSQGDKDVPDLFAALRQQTQRPEATAF